ncbi:DNA polymerase/3'-5' exonuclease PolX, partial [Candidatus Bathyarchaeota archaeon]|nr:DNA polymerase/3'-5' exonuclease PolX [Candidatus Bathyarchaeota archaeon]
LMQLEGVGPKTALRLNRELGITSIDQLEAAARMGRLRGVKGFGARTEENILKAIEEYRGRQERHLLGGIQPLVKGVISYMRMDEAVIEVEAVGSTRRMAETVGDLDILVSSERPTAVVRRFTSMPNISRVISKGRTRSTVILGKGVRVDLRVVPPESYGAALQYFTGSKEHNIKLRKMAKERGLKLSEYGLFERGSGKRIAGGKEWEIYHHLGLSWIEPELREDRGEIEAAASGSLPRLVGYGEVRGDLHLHTNWSDGTGTIEEMAEKAREMGLEYIAICDHSKTLGIARGLDEGRLREQMREIDRINERMEGFTILKGVECNIKADGNLDLSNSALRDLDFVIAAIHSGFKSDEKQMTERLIKAINNDHVSAIAHPTGRIIQRRRGYPLDLDRVLEEASRQGVMMEINAFPDRLDLNELNSRKAGEMGVTLYIGTDAHTPSQMDFLPLGVAVARRGWLEAGSVANTLDAGNLLRRIRKG